jgi:hypothetical protein
VSADGVVGHVESSASQYDTQVNVAYRRVVHRLVEFVGFVT